MSVPSKILTYLILSNAFEFHERIKQGREETDFYRARIKQGNCIITFQYWKDPKDSLNVIFAKGIMTTPSEDGVTQDEIHGFKHLQDILGLSISA